MKIHNKFEHWSNGELDRYLTAMECYMTSQDHTMDELMEVMNDISFANSELLRRMYDRPLIHDIKPDPWANIDFKAELEKREREDKDSR